MQNENRWKQMEITMKISKNKLKLSGNYQKYMKISGSIWKYMKMCTNKGK